MAEATALAMINELQSTTKRWECTDPTSDVRCIWHARASVVWRLREICSALNSEYPRDSCWWRSSSGSLWWVSYYGVVHQSIAQHFDSVPEINDIRIERQARPDTTWDSTWERIYPGK